jgi:hypothetical protein
MDRSWPVRLLHSLTSSNEFQCGQCADICYRPHREALGLLWTATGSDSLDLSSRSSFFPKTSSGFGQSWGWDEQPPDRPLISSLNDDDDNDDLPEVASLFPPSRIVRKSKNEDSTGDSEQRSSGPVDDFKWNQGHLMRLHGIDPRLFGWDDDEVRPIRK